MKFLLAVPALALALAAPASAEVVVTGAMPTTPWEELSTRTALAVIDSVPLATSGVTGSHVLIPGARVTPDAGTPGFFINFVAAGPNQAGVPCYGCVAPSGDGLGLPPPQNYVYSNYYWQYNVSWTNIRYSGPCRVAIAITEGSHVLEGAYSVLPSISGLGSFDWGFLRAPLNYHGPAILLGKITCGKHASEAKAKLIFE
jgi:hypothetical protein